MSNHLAYQMGRLTVSELSAIVDDLWQNLETDPDLRRNAHNGGIDLAKIPAIASHEALVIEQQESGFDPATTAIVVAFAPVAAEIIRDLWLCVLLPRILSENGDDAIGPNEPAD